MRTANTSENHGGDRGDEFLPEFGAGDSNANIVHQILSCFTILSNKARHFKWKIHFVNFLRERPDPSLSQPEPSWSAQNSSQIYVCDSEWSLSSVHTTRVHGPCSRAVQNDARVHKPGHGPWTGGSKNDTRIHGRCWSPVWTRVPSFDTRVHGPWTRREHGPWTRVVCTELLICYIGRSDTANRSWYGQL